MELWDIYDSDRRLTGRRMVRGEPFAPGDYHLVVHVCLFDGRGRMLIQERQACKQPFPGKWDLSVGGSAVAGEDSRTAAAREVREEIGLVLDLHDTRPYLSTCFDHGYDDIYLVEADLPIESLRLQPEEVRSARYATLDEILTMIRDGGFVPYREEYVRLLFALHGTPCGNFDPRRVIG